MEPTGEIRKDDGTFAKGVSGNPNGRPKGKMSLTTLLRDYLNEIPEGQDKSRAQQFIEKELERAMKGDNLARKHVLNYVEGLPKGSVDLTSGGKPIPILGGLTQDTNVFSDAKDEGADSGV